MLALQSKVATGDVAVLGVVGCGEVFCGAPFSDRLVADGSERKVGAQAERESPGQQDAVAGGEVHGLRDGFNNEPAVAGEQGVALNAGVARKLNGDGTGEAEAPGDIALRLEGGQHI